MPIFLLDGQKGGKLVKNAMATVRPEFMNRLFSDKNAITVKSFGMEFKIDDATLKKCNEFGTDMNAADRGGSISTLLQ